MPLYDYRCEGGHEYELSEGFHAPTEHPCPKCGRQSRRQISLPAVIFKGSGFYSTDNRKSGSNGKSGDSEPASTATDSPRHSRGPGGHSHGTDSTSKTEAATSD